MPNCHFPELVTSRFFLKQFQNKDVENVFKGLSNPKVIKYYGVSFSSLEATKEQMQWYHNLEKTTTGIWWAICDEQSGFYGAIGLSDINKERKSAEIGFWLLPKYWGKGIIKECMPEVLKYSFQKRGLFIIEAFVETENLNCYKVLKKMDFDYEKTIINAEIKNGKTINIAVFSKTNN